MNKNCVYLKPYDFEGKYYDELGEINSIFGGIGDYTRMFQI